MADLSDSTVAPLFLALSHLLGRAPVCCFCWPLDARGLCKCGACTKPKHPNPTRRLAAPPTNHSDYAPDVAAQFEDGRFGVLMGPSGLIVIDVDCKKGKPGFKSLAAMQERLGPLPQTLVQSTPSSGKHLFFRWPAARRGVSKSKGSNVYNAIIGLAPGVDSGIDMLVGEMDLALAGAGYTLEALPLAELPELPLAYFDALPAHWGQNGAQATGSYAGPAWNTHDEESLAWARAAFAADCRELPPGSAGNRNEPIGLVAMRARAYGLPPEEAIPIAFEHWNSRCSPPLDDPYDVEFTKRFYHQWQSGHGDVGGRITFQLAQWVQEVEDAYKANPLADVLGDEALAAWHENKSATEATALAAPRKEGRMLPNPFHEYGFKRTAGELGKLPVASSYDVYQILRSSTVWAGVFQWDEFADRPIAVNPPMRLELEKGEFEGNDITLITHWLNCVHSKNAKVEAVRDAVIALCRENTFHPLIEYLDGLDDSTLTVKAAEKRLFSWCAHDLHISDKEEQAAFVRQLVASVARIYRPGVEVHTCLVMCGKEGRGKTGLLKALFADSYAMLSGDLGNKDAQQKLVGRWCIELGEFSSGKSTKREALLAYITNSSDIFRRPYGMGMKTYPRTSTLWSTSNDYAILDEAGYGSRRFEPVSMPKPINLRDVAEYRDQVWQAARRLFLSGYQYWVDSAQHEAAEVRKREYVSEDVRGDMCLAFARVIHESGEKVTTFAILKMLYGGDAGGFSRSTRADEMMVGAALRRKGWTKTRAFNQSPNYLPPEKAE